MRSLIIVINAAARLALIAALALALYVVAPQAEARAKHDASRARAGRSLVDRPPQLPTAGEPVQPHGARHPEGQAGRVD